MMEPEAAITPPMVRDFPEALPSHQRSRRTQSLLRMNVITAHRPEDLEENATRRRSSRVHHQHTRHRVSRLPHVAGITDGDDATREGRCSRRTVRRTHKLPCRRTVEKLLIRTRTSRQTEVRNCRTT